MGVGVGWEVKCAHRPRLLFLPVDNTCEGFAGREDRSPSCPGLASCTMAGPGPRLCDPHPLPVAWGPSV